MTFEERAPLNEEGNGIYPLEQQTIHDSRKVANFHLHSSTENSKPYAGPSGNSQHGDIGLVFAQQIDGLVITKLEGNKFNVDFYTQGGAPISTVTKNLPVVDLGNYEYE
ncbi:hypothetical protein HYX13_02075 [Candidatus Woesearchaeota archaeon]|nr:hypothetical protein [Candidatus Woesearchaeota archaeon]